MTDIAEESEPQALSQILSLMSPQGQAEFQVAAAQQQNIALNSQLAEQLDQNQRLLEELQKENRANMDKNARIVELEEALLQAQNSVPSREEVLTAPVHDWPEPDAGPEDFEPEVQASLQEVGPLPHTQEISPEMLKQIQDNVDYLGDEGELEVDPAVTANVPGRPRFVGFGEGKARSLLTGKGEASD